jgi:hypothetical protein
VHRWFRAYLVVVNESIRRLFEDGFITSLTRPTEAGGRVLFDFRALDFAKLTYLLGIYLYIYLSHKYANYRLMNRYDGKQVLFLRGYDFEAAVSSDTGAAVGSYSMDTMQFGETLRDRLGGDTRLFKVASPMDLYWETIDAQRYFDGNYPGMQRLIGQRPASLYLNARGWQGGVADLLDRMDHYVVYVSSITESVMWELEQLDTDERRQRVTVVFDEKAIANKEGRAELPHAVAKRVGFQVTWSKEGAPPTCTASDLRAHLSSSFLVTTKDEFEKDIERHRERIAASVSPLPPGARETWIDFQFHPALEPDRLARLHDVEAALEATTVAAIRDGIECLPLFFAQIQLRIYTTLLLGQHEKTSQALATYAGVLRAAFDYFEPPGERIGALSPENREHHLSLLNVHNTMGLDTSVTLAASGKSHEFESIYEAATAAVNTTYDTAIAAVARFFAPRGGAVHD